MNKLTKEVFGVMLVNCGTCGSILSYNTIEKNCQCGCCDTYYDEDTIHECPDLFY